MTHKHFTSTIFVYLFLCFIQGCNNNNLYPDIDSSLKNQLSKHHIEYKYYDYPVVSRHVEHGTVEIKIDEKVVSIPFEVIQEIKNPISISFSKKNLSLLDLSNFSDNALKCIRFSESTFNFDTLFQLSCMKQLSSVEFNRCRLKGSDRNHTILKFPDNLTSIEVFKSDINSQVLNMYSVDSFGNLAYINLEGSEVNSKTMERIRASHSLRVLNLSNTNVDDDLLAYLKNLTNLNYLYLDQTKITNEGFQKITGLENLLELGVSETKLSGDISSEILRFPSLFSINAKNSLIDVSQIQAICPGVFVVQ